MALFKIANKRENKLNKVREIDFENEKKLQKITEENLQDILGLDFVHSEFSIKNHRIDTLAFNKRTKSFVIIEYKIRKAGTVVEQGMTYVSLMKGNREAFVFQYNDKNNARMHPKHVAWEKSKVIFISRKFTPKQKEVIDLNQIKEFLAELWEVKRYENGLIDYRKIGDSVTGVNAKGSSGEGGNTTTGEQSGGKVIHDTKIYTEGYHLNERGKGMATLYKRFKKGILALGDIKIKYNKRHINFNVGSVSIAFILIHKNQLTMRINMPQGQLKDSEEMMKDTSESKSAPRTNYKNKNKITSDMSNKDLRYILGLVEQSLRHHSGKKKTRDGRKKPIKPLTEGEQEHLARTSEEIAVLYNRFRSDILVRRDVDIVSNRRTINFIANSRIIIFRIQRSQLKIWIKMPKGKLHDPDNIMRDTSEIGNWAGADYEKVITPDENYGDILDLIEQSLEYDKNRQ